MADALWHMKLLAGLGAGNGKLVVAPSISTGNIAPPALHGFLRAQASTRSCHQGSCEGQILLLVRVLFSPETLHRAVRQADEKLSMGDGDAVPGRSGIEPVLGQLLSVSSGYCQQTASKLAGIGIDVGLVG